MATRATNPFFDYDIAKMGEFLKTPDIGKMLGEMKLTGVDTESILVGQRKNLEALKQANQLAVEGLQAVAKRQAEILRQTMEEAGNAVREMMAVGSPEEKVARQTEITKDAFQTAIANMRELAEMVVKSNTSAFDVMNQRVAESLDEFRSMLVKKPGKTQG